MDAPSSSRPRGAHDARCRSRHADPDRAEDRPDGYPSALRYERRGPGRRAARDWAVVEIYGDGSFGRPRLVTADGPVEATHDRPGGRAPRRDGARPGAGARGPSRAVARRRWPAARGCPRPGPRRAGRRAVRGPGELPGPAGPHRGVPGEPPTRREPTPTACWTTIRHRTARAPCTRWSPPRGSTSSAVSSSDARRLPGRGGRPVRPRPRAVARDEPAAGGGAAARGLAAARRRDAAVGRGLRARDARSPRPGGSRTCWRPNGPTPCSPPGSRTGPWPP